MEGSGLNEHDIDTVRATYNQVAEAYLAERDRFASLPYLDEFAGYLPAGGRVLDLGCGGGVPVAAYLADKGFDVRGLDLSDRMIALARQNVPGASFEVGNMLELHDRQFQVDGVVSFYAIFHTPRDRHEEILKRAASFLPPRGVLLITMGSSDWEGTEEFHGSPMVWSHFGAERNTRIVEAAGFDIIRKEIDYSDGEAHQVMLARKH